MIRTVSLTLLCGAELLDRAVARYDLLDRLSEACQLRGLTLLAFGLGEEELRLVLEGPTDEIARAMARLRMGTARHYAHRGHTIVWSDPTFEAVSEEGLAHAIHWAHSCQDDDPLATPWTSLRDLLGFRRASFFDPARARTRLAPADLPPVTPPMKPRSSSRHHTHGLDRLLRVAAATLGVLPANRICFRLFVQLGRQIGYSSETLAAALHLTPRRIRQLQNDDEPLLSAALFALDDTRLAVVP
jgi:hypothetical protein